MVVRSRLMFCSARCIAALIIMVAGARAQDAEPRLYSNTPVGLNFLIAGYIYAQGKMAFDPTLRIADADFHQNAGAECMCGPSIFLANPPSSM